MGLTSGSFLALTIGAAICWLAATVWLWPRLAGPGSGDRDGGDRDGGYRDGGYRDGGYAGGGRHGPRPDSPLSWRRGGRLAGRVAARAGLLTGGQVLVIAAFLVWLNGYFAFYGSWAQLLGASSPAKAKPAAAQGRQPFPAQSALPTAPAAGRGGALTAAGRRQLLRSPIRYYGAGLGPGPGLLALPPSAFPGGLKHLVRLPGAASYGEILRVAIKGQRTGLVTSAAYIYLPPQYFQPAFARHRFPAVLAFTGYPGGATSIIDRLGLPGTAAELTAAGRARPVVYVMMNVSPQFPRDTECTNIPGGPQVASFFAIDVPLAVERTFRVTALRTGWATLGYSTGGYCAAKLAMLYPSRFSAAVSIAAYFHALQDRTTGNLYGIRAYQHENDLFWRLQHLPAPPVSVLVTSSKIGETTYPGTLRFLRLVHAPMHGYAYILPVGGHNFGVWSQELPQAIKWLSARLTTSGTAPRSGQRSLNQQGGPQPAGAYASG